MPGRGLEKDWSWSLVQPKDPAEPAQVQRLPSVHYPSHLANPMFIKIINKGNARWITQRLALPVLNTAKSLCAASIKQQVIFISRYTNQHDWNQHPSHKACFWLGYISWQMHRGTWQLLFSAFACFFLHTTSCPTQNSLLGLKNKTYLCSWFLQSRSLIHWCSVVQLDWWVRRAKRYGRKEGTWDPAWKDRIRKRCNKQILAVRWM